MIVSKPKVRTIASVGLFVLAAFSLSGYGVHQVQQTNDRFWWFVLIYTTGPIGMVVLIKILTGIQYLKIGKEKFEFFAPFKFKKITFTGKQLSQWTSEKIKTYGGLYEEIVWRLANGKEFRISKQENTQFDEIHRYMKRKFKRIEQ